MPEQENIPERDRVERFESAYNRIDKRLSELTGSTGEDRRRPFASKVRIAANRMRRLARHADFLLEVGDLRNAIVHNRLDPESYIAVPNASTVVELERIEKLLFLPERVLPRFERDVKSLQHDQTLAQGWQLVRDDGYSRYPVYRNGDFLGLLTSNGFARYCAGQLRDGKIHLDARNVRIEEVLEVDHRRDSALFMSRETLIEDAAQMFIQNPRTEAILITEHGKSHEKPLGMICPPDIASLEL